MKEDEKESNYKKLKASFAMAYSNGLDYTEGKVFADPLILDPNDCFDVENMPWPSYRQDDDEIDVSFALQTSLSSMGESDKKRYGCIEEKVFPDPPLLRSEDFVNLDMLPNLTEKKHSLKEKICDYLKNIYKK